MPWTETFSDALQFPTAAEARAAIPRIQEQSPAQDGLLMPGSHVSLLRLGHNQETAAKAWGIVYFCGRKTLWWRED